jgi:pimeloyl-ACP methyl ester carboxylesterase
MEPVETVVPNLSMLPGRRDLSQGVIVILSGGPVDMTNPVEVRNRMDQIITEVNADPSVLANSGGKGVIFRLLENQGTNHIHQARWRDLCDVPELLAASPIIIVGHSNGGAAAMDLARFLQENNREVDFLFTADSVLTLDDNGDPYTVPANVKINLNSYSVPVFPIWLALPFPFGRKNYRQADVPLDGILNIGLQFAEPGAIEHKDVFYAPAGGDPSGNTYEYPELTRDSALSVLKGATPEEVFDMAKGYLQTLADEARIPIYLEGVNLTETLVPASTAATAQVVKADDATIANLHEQITTMERTPLSIGA